MKNIKIYNPILLLVLTEQKKSTHYVQQSLRKIIKIYVQMILQVVLVKLETK